MPSIHVCPLSKIDETARACGARTLVTLMERGFERARPRGIARANHLIVSISDIVDPLDGHVLPNAGHIDDLLRFVSRWDRRAPMVIHCFAGVSRSTAAAFIAACALEPAAPESRFAETIRAKSPTATPNRLLVALADARLGREGRMTQAIAAIGRGDPCYEGRPFSIDLAAGRPGPS